MQTFIAAPHQSQITVEYTEEIDALIITVDECPNSPDPEYGIAESVNIPIANVPGLISALTKAYECVTGKKS